MSNMNGKSQLSRQHIGRNDLAEQITQKLTRNGSLEVQPGIFFHRASTKEPLHTVIEPSFCVIAQGSKEVLVGEDRYRYDPAHYLIATMELPAVGKVVEASLDKPYLSFRLVLDPALVTSVMVESGIVSPRGEGTVKALDVSPLDSLLMDAVLRLARLTQNVSEFRVLGPLVVREIIYRLLTGKQAGRLCHVACLGGQDHRMVRAVRLLTKDFNKSLSIDEIADTVGMSVSGFHAHFKAVTSMSPLQFQKQLRLQEARRLMLSENLDAGEAGYRVGYDDQSHFSREYKRHFGKPPIQDVDRLREQTSVQDGIGFKAHGPD